MLPKLGSLVCVALSVFGCFLYLLCVGVSFEVPKVCIFVVFTCLLSSVLIFGFVSSPSLSLFLSLVVYIMGSSFYFWYSFVSLWLFPLLLFDCIFLLCEF